MKIKSTEKIIGLPDGISIYKYHFTEKWTLDKIMNLAEIGDLEYMGNLPEPTFTLKCSNGLSLEGVEDETTCIVSVPEDNLEQIMEEFEQALLKGKYMAMV